MPDGGARVHPLWQKVMGPRAVCNRDPMEALRQFLGPARSLCPICLSEAEGGYFSEEGKVILQRRCKDHGTIASPFWDDIRHFLWTQSVDARAGVACCAPGTPGCGVGDGAKRCVTVVPITDACNLECPYCFATSGPRGANRELDEIEGMLRGALRENGGPTPLQLSGGEPTVHPEILDIVRAARDLGYRHIEVNTNGVLLAAHDGFAAALREAGVDAIYLQFDGLEAASYAATRGLDLVTVKRKAVEAARRAGLHVILAATVVKDRNDHELGSIVRFALANRDVVRGVNFQPVRHFGRYAEDTGHLSLDVVARLLAEQTGFLRSEDLLPFPCCSAACYVACVVIATPTGGVPLTRFVRDERFLGEIASLNERRYLDLLAGTEDAARVVEDLACACGIPMTGLAGKMLREGIVVSAAGFMDAQTVDLDRMARCCVRVATREGRLAPFCGYYLTDARGVYAWRNRHYPEDADLPALRAIP